MVPKFFSRWAQDLNRSEAATFLAAWSLWEAHEDTVLMWPDEPADSVWVLESGELQVTKKSHTGEVLHKTLREIRPTPCALLKSSDPTGLLIRAVKGCKLWRLEKRRLVEWRARHPRAFEKLSRTNGPLADLADWKPPPPPRPIQKRMVLHPPAIFYLGWCLLALILALPGVALLIQGLPGGWLAIVLSTLVFLERSLNWFGEFLDLRPDRIVYVKTDLLRRTSRRWSARWSDIQNIEVAQTGWVSRILDLVNLSLSTRSFAQPLMLKNWNGSVARLVREGRDQEPQPVVRGSLRSLWERLRPTTESLVQIYPPPTKAEATSSCETRRFVRHPLTWFLRTARGLGALTGAGLLIALGLATQALILIALGLVSGAFGLSVLIWEWWDWVNDTYALERDKLVDVERRPFWLGSLRREIPLASLQSVEVDQKGLLPILFDYGIIRLTSAGGGPGLDWTDLAHPSEVHELLFELKRETDERQRKVQEAERFDEMTAAIKAVEILKSWGLSIQ